MPLLPDDPANALPADPTVPAPVATPDVVTPAPVAAPVVAPRTGLLRQPGGVRMRAGDLQFAPPAVQTVASPAPVAVSAPDPVAAPSTPNPALALPSWAQPTATVATSAPTPSTAPSATIPGINSVATAPKQPKAAGIPGLDDAAAPPLDTAPPPPVASQQSTPSPASGNGGSATATPPMGSPAAVPDVASPQPASDAATGQDASGLDIAGGAKATAYGAAKGAGFLLASAPGAAAGAEVGTLLAPFTAGLSIPAGSIIGGLITGTLGSKAVEAGANELAKHSDLAESFVQASQQHPYLDAAGNLVSFAAGLPRAATEAIAGGLRKLAGESGGGILSRLFAGAADHYANSGGLATTISNLNKDAANRVATGATATQAAQAVAARVATRAATNVAIDTALKEGGKALGMDGDHQTLGGATQAALIGAFTAGNGLGQEGYGPHEVADIVTRDRLRARHGLEADKGVITPDQMPEGIDSFTASALAKPLSAKEMEVVDRFGQTVRQMQSSGKLSANPSVAEMQDLLGRSSATQSTDSGKPYGVTSIQTTDAAADASDGVPAPSSQPLLPSSDQLETSKTPAAVDPALASPSPASDDATTGEPPSPTSPPAQEEKSPSTPSIPGLAEGQASPALDENDQQRLENLQRYRDGQQALLDRGRVAPEAVEAHKGLIGQLDQEIARLQSGPASPDNAASAPSSAPPLEPPASPQTSSDVDAGRAPTQSADTSLDAQASLPQAKEISRAGLHGSSSKSPEQSLGNLPPPNARDAAETASREDVSSTQPSTISPPDNEQPSVGAINGFKTAKGSTYQLHEDGSTTRTKTLHEGHDPNDVGLKPRSTTTVYVDPELAQHVGMWQGLQSSGKRIGLTNDGEVITVSDNPLTGKRGRDRGEYGMNNRFSRTPAVGLAPLELSHPDPDGFFRGNHPGNPITELSHEQITPQPTPAGTSPAPGTDALAAPADGTQPARGQNAVAGREPANAIQPLPANESALSSIENPTDHARLQPATSEESIPAGSPGASGAGIPASGGPHRGELAEQQQRGDAARTSNGTSPAPDSRAEANGHLEAAQAFHAAEIAHHGVTFQTDAPETPVAANSGLHLEVGTKKPTIRRNPASFSASVARVNAASEGTRDGKGWVQSAVSEELHHHRDVVASGGRFMEVHQAIHEAMTPEAKRETSTLYPDNTQPVVQAAEYLRMLAQRRRGEPLTESHYRDTKAMEAILDGPQLDVVEQHLAKMERLAPPPSSPPSKNASVPEANASEHSVAQRVDEPYNPANPEKDRSVSKEGTSPALSSPDQTTAPTASQSFKRPSKAALDSQAQVVRALKKLVDTNPGKKGIAARYQTAADRLAEMQRQRATPLQPGESPRSFRMPAAPNGEPDVLDHIRQEGGIISPNAAKKRVGYSRYAGEYDGAPTLGGFYHHAVFGGDKFGPDQMAEMIRDNYGIGDGTPDGLWREIGKAVETRRKDAAQRANFSAREKQADAFDRDALSERTAKGGTEINTSTLAVGDKVKVNGETLTVTSLDPDTLDLTLEDHSKYGVQHVADGQAMYVEQVQPVDGQNSNLPKLRDGERQGDLMASQSEDLKLVGDKGIDYGARQAAQEQREREAAEARAKQEREQQKLFTAVPPDSRLQVADKDEHYREVKADNATVAGPATFTLYAASPLVAYHGTPHEVDRFDSSKIGTGEGAQVYGHGLYFAQSEKVARSYQKGLTEKDLINKVREVYGEFDGSEEAEAALKLAGLSEGQQKLVDALKKDDWLGFDYPHQAVRAALRNASQYDLGEDTKAALRTFGNLYSVHLDAEPDELLDWDKPLVEQSDLVQTAIDDLMRQFGDADDIEYLEQNWKHMDGQDAHDALAVAGEQPSDDVAGHISTNGARAKKIAERLLSKGVLGIRYLDGNSRKQGDGTSNYVIFDDSRIKITHRNGEPVKPEEVPSLFAANPVDNGDNVGDAQTRGDRPEEDRAGAAEDRRDSPQVQANLARSGGPPDPGSRPYGPTIQREVARQIGVLTRAAETNGQIVRLEQLARNGPVQGQGQEHQVRIPANPERVTKTTLGGRGGYGITPYVRGENIGFRPGTPAEYLDRLALQNAVFDDDIQVTGIYRDPQGEDRLVTSQPFVASVEPPEKPTPQEIADYMAENGFAPVNGQDANAFYRASDNVAVLDAHDGNFIKTADGPVPIDLAVVHPDERLLAVIKKGLAGAEASDAPSLFAATPPAATSTPDAFSAARGFVKSIADIDLPTPKDVEAKPTKATTTVAEKAASAKEAIVNAVRDAGKLKPLTPLDHALRTLGADKALVDLHTNELIKNFVESVPDERTREALTHYVQAGGNRQMLEGRRDSTTDPKQKARYQKALDLTPEELKVAPAIREYFEAMLGEGQAAKIIEHGRENYINQIVKQPFFDLAKPGEENAPKTGGGKYSTRFRFADPRQFPSLYDVEQAGYKPETYDAAKLMGVYNREFGRALMTRKFIDTLRKSEASDGRPLVDDKAPAPELRPGATPAEIEAAKADDRSDYVVNDNLRALNGLGVHPEVARSVSNVLGRSALSDYLRSPSSNPFIQAGKAAVRGFEHVQGTLKETMFDLSPFHITTEGLHATGHGVNPFGAIEHFDPTNPEHQEALYSGLMVVSNPVVSQDFTEGLTGGSRSLVRKVPGLNKFAAGMSDFLFHAYIPNLKIKTWRRLMAGNMKRFEQEIADGKLTRADVAGLTSDQVNAAYGHLNYTALARNPTMQHIFRSAALAPDFLEARLRFTGQAARSAFGKVGHEQLKAMAILFASQFVITRLFNAMFDDGKLHLDEPFSAFYKGRSYTLRSVPEDIWKAVTNTAQFISGRESPAVRTGVQLLTGRNYRGERTDATDTLREAAAGALPISLRDLPGLNQLSTTQRNSTITAWEQVLSACGFHVARVSPENDVYRLASEYKKSQGIKEDTGSHPVSKFQPLKYALEDNDTDRAKSEWQALLGDKPDPSKVQKLAVGFRNSIQHPFTQNRAMDEQFAALLKGDDLDKYKEALAQRKDVYSRFRQIVSPDEPAPSDLSPRARALAAVARRRGNVGLAKTVLAGG